jgi:F0F1-type ATP synthase alpha subunit
LDESTRKQLERWKRMMELLKQWVYAPVSVSKQVCAMYAWTNWFLDEIDVSRIARFESDFYAALDDEKTILESIDQEKVIKEDKEIKLKEILGKIIELNK